MQNLLIAVFTFQATSKQCWQEEVKLIHLHVKEMFDTLSANWTIRLRNILARCETDGMQTDDMQS